MMSHSYDSDRERKLEMDALAMRYIEAVDRGDHEEVAAMRMAATAEVAAMFTELDGEIARANDAKRKALPVARVIQALQHASLDGHYRWN